MYDFIPVMLNEVKNCEAEAEAKNNYEKVPDND